MPGWSSPTALVGRDRELAEVRRFVAASAASGGSLLIVGEAGIGKTALLESAGTAAAEAGMRVLHASGVEFEAEVSFAALHQLLAPLAGDLPALPRAQRDAIEVALGLGAGSPADPLALVNAVIALLARRAAGGAMLLLIDDLHWLDRASATLLASLARRLAGQRIGLLGALRTEEQSVFAEAGLPEVVLGALGAEDAAALLSAAYPTLPSRAASQVLEEAQGNPLALIELPTRAGSADPAASRTPVGRRLRLHFAHAIEALPVRTREELLLAALDGSGVVFPAVSLPDLQPAERARLIRVQPVTHSVQFRHPLARSAVVDLSTDTERREAHRRLAEHRPTSSPRRAWHLAQAATAPDEAIARLLEEAALTTKSRGDPVGAIGLLLRAAELSPAPADNTRRALFATYLGADVTGDLADPGAIARSSVTGEGRSVAAAVAAAAYLVNGGGDIDTIHGLLLGALRNIAAPIREWDAALVEIVYVLQANCSFGSRADLVADYRAALDRLGLEPPEGLALLGATFLEPVRTALPALAALDEAIAAIDEQADHAHAVRLAIAAMYVDRLAGCRPALRRVLEHGRAGGAVASAIKAFALLCFDGLLTGEWDETLRLAEEGLEVTARHHYRLLGGFLQYDRAMVAAARGDQALVRTLTDELTGWAAPNGVGFVLQLASHARAVAALSDSDYETAYRHALDVCSPGTVPGFKPAALWMLLELVESAVRAGRLEQARQHVAELDDANVAALSPRLAFTVAAAHALVAGDRAFAGDFARALAVPDAARWPFALARVRLAFGERLRRAKALTEARSELTEALATFERLGAEPWAARARAELRAGGRAPNRAPSLLAALTPQQRQIAELAAAGLSNRQIGERLFLSPRTVGAHLYQLFPKLGVTSRAALRDALEGRTAG